LSDKPYQDPVWFKQKHLEAGWSINKMARKCGVAWATIRDWGDKLGIPLQKEKNMGSKQYPNLESSPELSYLLGVLDGDGNVSGNNLIQLGTKDFEFAEEFANALRAINLRANVIEKNYWNKDLKRQYHGWRCYARSVVFVRWFKGLTQEQKEGIAKQFPEEYLKGFFESEGSYNINTNGGAHVYFSNFDYELLLMVQRLLTTLGYESRIYENKRKSQFTGEEKTTYRLNLLGSSEDKHEFIRRIKPVIKNKPYDYSDPNGLRGRKPKNRY